MKNLLNEKKVNRIDRGITLLLVLAMMTLFSVLIISFMLITSAAKNMAVNQARVLLDPKDRSTENAKKESASAIGTILFGDNNSVFGSLSILENLYGNRPIRRTMGNFGISPTSNDLRRIYWADEPTRLQLGHVLTITNFNYTGSISNAQQVIIDKYKNQSRLIKNFGTDGNGNYIEVEKFSDNDVSEIQLLGSISGSTWEFIINSPAFSGTGEGFVYTPPNTPAISDMSNLASIPRVFLPNVEGYGNNTMMNPDYTAPDHLNWFLAWYDINAAGGISDGDIIPSFHRPKLIKHLYDSGLLSSPALLEAATLRPLPTRHPKFTGSNATATNATATSLINFLTHGSGAEWDVDNDGDGIKDSIWIDIDLPTFEDRSRSGPAIKVKPLIAVLIRDLDGLINVNAHGNVTHYDSPASPSSIKTISGVSEEGEFGSGMGPAEVKLNVLDNVLSQTLIGRRRIASGSSEVPAGVNAANYASYPDNVGLGRLYPDFWGYAQVIFEPMGYRFFDLAMYNYPLYQNNPYMTDVYRNKGNPFSVAELEPFIRSKNDIDSYQFAETLKDIFGGYENNNFKNNRYLITTHSSSIPAMSKSGGSDSTGNFFNLRERINRYTIYDVNCQTIIKNLPPEIIRGEKINLNKVANLSTAEKSEFAHQLFLLLMVLCHDKIKDNVSYNENPAVTGGQPLTSEQMITRLAQWSVNVVDFIDADAAMTPLVFSIKPFADMKIYDLNGNYKNPINVTDFPAYQDIRIVFGKEDNDLFITKTFATHNRNTADSKQDNPTEDTTTNKPKGYVNSNTNHDQHYDQIFKPEGSLFVELYRAADPTRRRTPNDFYNSDNSLDLAKTNPDGEPVWRIAISKHTKTHPNDTQPTSNYRINSVVNNLEHPRTSNAYPFQPTQWNGAASTQQEIAKDTVKSERFIYFVNDIPNFINTNLADSESMIKSMSFVNIGGVNNDGTRTGNNVVLQPNNFLLIAPRVLTSFKSKEVDETTTTDKFGVPDGLDDGSDGTKINLKSLSSNSVKTMVAAMKIDNIFSWKDTPNILALGFKTGDPTPALDTRYRGVGVNVSEILPNTGINVGEASYYAKPTFESDTEKDYYPSNTTDFNNPYPTTTVYGEERTEDADFVMGFGTIPGFRSMFLQRLADADRRYHPVNNPYITVDWSMIDLHVFTSEKVKNAPFATGGFANSREGEFAAPAANNPTDRLKFTGDPKLYFNIREWGTTANHDEDDFTTPPTPIASLPTRRPNIRHRSFRTVEVTSAGTTTNVEVIENNPSLLGNEIANKYEPPKLPTSNDNPKWGQLSYKYGAKHTSASADLDTSGNFHPNVDLAGIPQQGFLHFPWNDSPLANTFELMLVPAVSASRFGYDCYDTATIIPLKMGKSLGMDGNARFRNKTSGTGPYLNFFTNGRPNPDGAGDSLDLVRLFEYVHVPSRFISTNQPLSAMREPGKININTMTEKSWQALVGDSIVNTNYANIKDQRNPTAAIEFANPFRSSHAANFVPELMMSRQPVETTLLGLIEPKLVADNIYTSLHPIMRLSEMTTTRSNVFAIWITTGYFKVEGEGDGEQLCEEIGSYGGKMERRRDFYIIDRSIPVGFIRGEKLNTDNIILLKKSLE